MRLTLGEGNVFEKGHLGEKKKSKTNPECFSLTALVTAAIPVVFIPRCIKYLNNLITGTFFTFIPHTHINGKT